MAGKIGSETSKIAVSGNLFPVMCGRLVGKSFRCPEASRDRSENLRRKINFFVNLIFCKILTLKLLFYEKCQIGNLKPYEGRYKRRIQDEGQFCLLVKFVILVIFFSLGWDHD